LLAQIVGIVDVFDSLTSAAAIPPGLHRRPRGPVPHRTADIGKFASRCVQVFLETL
jgi:hypothetical protein